MKHSDAQLLGDRLRNARSIAPVCDRPGRGPQCGPSRKESKGVEHASGGARSPKSCSGKAFIAHERRCRGRRAVLSGRGCTSVPAPSRTRRFGKLCFVGRVGFGIAVRGLRLGAGRPKIRTRHWAGVPGGCCGARFPLRRATLAAPGDDDSPSWDGHLQSSAGSEPDGPRDEPRDDRRYDAGTDGDDPSHRTVIERPLLNRHGAFLQGLGRAHQRRSSL
jgi:hypothetical protein